MSLDAEPAAPSRAAGTGTRPRDAGAGRENTGLLVVIPVLVAVVFAAWALWRGNADLDSIEARQLDWTTITTLLWQHVGLTVVSAILVVAVAVPLGIALTRPRSRALAPVAVGIANAGQAAPAIGLIVLLAIWLGFGFGTAVVALTLYAVLPVLRNTITGIEGIDPTLVEAGRGIGMSGAGVLLRVELPLAVPVIMTGVRTALVLLVGTATLATFINAGGLGSLIVTGITLFRYPVLVSGALLVALLALLIDWAGRVLELTVQPKGLRR
ncbi:ABC transporter permease [Rhodococcus aetherivorans]|uniref:ABC transporter permease n=1 Tax=Rhodococcus aetherivorans TaxID=191292 RepID=UPI0002D22ADB|nr:ABC transporter permease [Rhodococcus aetherivorans]WKW96963.1 ABC transporter permease [Rhodococcus aetherivorans]CCW12749.1 binding-protein-dependent transport systems inner membrane component [Rhodococcus aetherivorans]